MRECSILFGFLLVVAGTSGLWTDLRLAISGEVAEAVVVEISAGNVTCEFADKAEPDEKYRAAVDVRALPTAPVGDGSRDAFRVTHVGDRVSVRYLPTNPDVCRAAGAWPVWPFPILAIGFLTVLAGILCPRRASPYGPEADGEYVDSPR